MMTPYPDGWGYLIVSCSFRLWFVVRFQQTAHEGIYISAFTLLGAVAIDNEISRKDMDRLQLMLRLTEQQTVRISYMQPVTATESGVGEIINSDANFSFESKPTK